ncbi:MAG: iron ABC transporter permease [Anaerolineaceae bacterium]|jgi:iron complex transport system permease protein|nr:iron ABC transporter permease [Anaerolineaceae bacterium]
MTKRLTPFGILSLILLAAVLLNVSIGSSGMPLSTLFDVLGAALHGTAAASDPNGVYATILFQLRLPHMVLMLLVGAALAGSGAAYQGLFRNPLADPYLIGVASGAGLGAVAAMSVHWPYNAVGWMAVPLSAFIGAVLAVAVVAMMARVGKTIPTTNLILAGVVVSSFCSALSSLLMINASGDLRRALVWLLGGATQTGWSPVLAILPYLIPGLLVLLIVGHSLNVLQFGEEQASQLGVAVTRVRWLTIVAATLATAAAVAYAGVIGFVGLIVPHIIRLLWGSDYRRLIPLSFLGGACLLLLTDATARTVIAPQEIPVGIITSLLGAPFFLWILRRTKSQNYW